MVESKTPDTSNPTDKCPLNRIRRGIYRKINKTQTKINTPISLYTNPSTSIISAPKAYKQERKQNSSGNLELKS